MTFSQAFHENDIPAAIEAMKALPVTETRLYLNFLNINSPEKITALAHLPPTVTSLDLSYNRIPDVHKNSLLALLKNNRHLTIDISHNYLLPENLGPINPEPEWLLPVLPSHAYCC